MMSAPVHGLVAFTPIKAWRTTASRSQPSGRPTPAAPMRRHVVLDTSSHLTLHSIVTILVT